VTGFAYIWEFKVEPSCLADFERHYGPQGTWAQLFRRSPGYIETLVLRDADDPLRCITIDRWRSAEDYAAFGSRVKREYEELDARCEAVTMSESSLGKLTEIA
jgi:heme-degrading monooxygenase HmoA